MITAIVMIDTDASRIPEVAKEAVEIVGISEVFSVTGDVDLVAISFFQGEGQFRDEDDAPEADAQSDDPFLAQLATYTAHPELTLLEDEIDGQFALVRLTQEEFDRGPAAPPADVRREGEHGNDDEGPNAWDDDAGETRRVRLVVRTDPNAGTAPNEDGDDGYEAFWDAEARDIATWAKPLFGRCHLGGTAFPVQSMPDGLTPTYLEIDELPGMNLGGGGVAQIDLESGTFDWACG